MSQIFTLQQLAKYNGQDKPEIFCAYNGRVYDVSRSKLWKKGQHYEHFAGQDLTKEMADAPHTEHVFDKFDVVGYLVG